MINFLFIVLGILSSIQQIFGQHIDMDTSCFLNQQTMACSFANHDHIVLDDRQDFIYLTTTNDKPILVQKLFDGREQLYHLPLDRKNLIAFHDISESNNKMFVYDQSHIFYVDFGRVCAIDVKTIHPYKSRPETYFHGNEEQLFFGDMIIPGLTSKNARIRRVKNNEQYDPFNGYLYSFVSNQTELFFVSVAYGVVKVGNIKPTQDLGVLLKSQTLRSVLKKRIQGIQPKNALHKAPCNELGNILNHQ